jgi:hypothetical protein
MATALLIYGSFYFSNALANNNANTNISRFECASCHGSTSPNLPSGQGFIVLDPDTQSGVSAYEPGKTYTLQIKFNNPSGTSPWRNAYVLHVADITTGTAQRAGTLIDPGSNAAGIVTDTGPTNPQSNSRIVTEATRIAADNLSIQWQAPQSGRVRFQLIRMESNNNNATNGDRSSQAIEQYILNPVGVAPGNSAPPTGNLNDPSSASTGTGFTSNFTAACSLNADSGSQTYSPLHSLWLFILALGLLAGLRYRSTRALR